QEQSPWVLEKSQRRGGEDVATAGEGRGPGVAGCRDMYVAQRDPAEHREMRLVDRDFPTGRRAQEINRPAPNLGIGRSPRKARPDSERRKKQTPADPRTGGRDRPAQSPDLRESGRNQPAEQPEDARRGSAHVNDSFALKSSIAARPSPMVRRQERTGLA